MIYGDHYLGAEHYHMVLCGFQRQRISDRKSECTMSKLI
jgi:hypothetical protein